jgi:uncharacterized membrane protein
MHPSYVYQLLKKIEVINSFDYHFAGFVLVPLLLIKKAPGGM